MADDVPAIRPIPGSAAKALVEEGHPVREVAALFGVNRMTIYRELAR